MLRPRMDSVWQWEDDSGWQDYASNDATLLEQAFQAGSSSQLVCNGYVTISFRYNVYPSV
jgi:hypothetical protein